MLPNEGTAEAIMSSGTTTILANITQGRENGLNYILRAINQEPLVQSGVSENPDMSGKSLGCPIEYGTALLTLNCLIGILGKEDSQVQKLGSNLRSTRESSGKFHFFENSSLLPEDTDTTSFGSASLYEIGLISLEEAKNIAQMILSNTSANNIIDIYWNPESQGRENRNDEVALANIAYFLTLSGSSGPVYDTTVEIITRRLVSKAFIYGTRYYHSPEVFLYFISRLMCFEKLRKKLLFPLKEALEGIVWKEVGPLSLAMFIIIQKTLGSNTEEYQKHLLEMQRDDGSFPAEGIYRYGGSQGNTGYFGSSIITTAFASLALSNNQKLIPDIYNQTVAKIP